MSDPRTSVRVYALVAALANLLILDGLLALRLVGAALLTDYSTHLDLAALNLSLIATIVAVMALLAALDAD